MRDSDPLVIIRRSRLVWDVLLNGASVLVLSRQVDGAWRIRRQSDGRSIASVLDDGRGRVSRSFQVDGNLLVRIVANLVDGDSARAGRLARRFIDGHRSTVFGTTTR